MIQKPALSFLYSNLVTSGLGSRSDVKRSAVGSFKPLGVGSIGGLQSVCFEPAMAIAVFSNRHGSPLQRLS